MESEHRPSPAGPFARICRVIVASLALSLALEAQDSSSEAKNPRDQAPTDDGATKKTPWSIDDIVLAERATSWQLSPDGARALWIHWKADAKNDRHVSQLMLLDIATGESRALTHGADGISSARFSDEGDAILFLSSRPPASDANGKKPPKPQVWRLDLGGGEPSVLTSLEHGVRSFQPISSRKMFLRARERLTRREHQLKKDKDDTIVVEDPLQLADEGSALFQFDVATKKLVRVVARDRALPSLAGFSASPNGRYVVTWHHVDASFEAEGRRPPRWFLRDLDSGTSRELFAERRSKPLRVSWMLDSSGFFLRYPHASVDGEDSAAVEYLTHIDAKTGARTDIDLDWEPGLDRLEIVVLSDGFLASLHDGVRPKLARYTRTASGAFHREDLEAGKDTQILSLIKARSSDRVLYLTGSASDPSHVMSATLRGTRLDGPKEVYRPNDGFSSKKIARTEVTRWVGSLEEQVEGIVYYPHDYRPGKKHPLVVITHGGPHSLDRNQFSERWSNSPNLYAQRGAFVLKTNYHGSAGYGLAFGESIKGRYYELEIRDILSGVQHLVDRGLVDTKRMGLVGWSNGAILSIACLTLAHRYAPEFDFTFRACAPGAGDVNWTSDYGNCAFGGVFDDFYLGGPPWKLPDVYLEKSPLFQVERVTTPTIIFFGTEDRAVPTSQGWEWYRALHSVGKAPVRFLLFPGEPHGLRKLSHQRRKLSEELAWFDRHLFETAEPEPRVPPGSPLDVARTKLGFPRVGSRLGILHEGHLIPETISFGEVEVTRFEITVAQWQAFDGDFARAVPEGLRAFVNHPATGITVDDANAYIAWLRETTGEPWRLPTEDEISKLASASGPSPNNLDYWAGYSPPPGEAAALAGEIAKLPLSSVLLAVGSRPPGRLGKGSTAELIFDVGGNAAELATTEDGRAIALGGSADGTKDRSARSSSTPSDFVGLRLIRGESPRRESDRPEKAAPARREI